MEENVTVSIKDLPKLKALYKSTVASRKEVFYYKGKEILVSYCKYLIEYLEGLKK